MIAPREMLLDGGVDDLLARLHRSTTVERRGRLVELLGTTMKVTGIAARIGETCEVVVPATGDAVMAEHKVSQASEAERRNYVSLVWAVAAQTRDILKSPREVAKN